MEGPFVAGAIAHEGARRLSSSVPSSLKQPLPNALARLRSRQQALSFVLGAILVEEGDPQQAVGFGAVVREHEDKDYDVRDLIGVLEVLNIFDFPNDMTTGKHPIAAYEKWSTPLGKFATDYEQHKNNLKDSTYHRLRKLLVDGLVLYDMVRHDFRDMRNEAGGAAGKMNILEEASNDRTFEFPFGGLTPSKYRLTKGATFPILSAFRTYVEQHPKTGEAGWRGGFERVRRVWREAGPTLVEETFQLTREGARNPDQVGKNRKHWGNLYMQLQVRLLQERLNERDAKLPAARRR